MCATTIMRQQDPQGKGKYYQDRRIAFENAYESDLWQMKATFSK